MVIISALGVFLSLFYNRQELAILATIGGFITPFLVSTGQDNYTALFTYLCFEYRTDGTCLVQTLAGYQYHRPCIYYTDLRGWLTRRLLYSSDPLPRAEALFYTLFYLLFIAM